MILHASLHGGSLWFWGIARSDAPAPSRRRASDASQIPRLPEAASGADLTKAIAACPEMPGIPAGRSSAVVRRDLAVWLPTVAGAPLLAAPPQPSGEAALAPYRIAAVCADGAALVACLSAALAEGEQTSEYRCGATLAFWASATRLAASLVARRLVVPSAELGEAGLAARWRPVIAGDDADVLIELAECMPAACRALGDIDAACPARRPAAVLTEFVAALTDLLVRLPNLEPASRRRVRLPIADRWLAALRTPDVACDATATEAGEFVSTVREWQRPMATTSGAPFRLTFRLEDPVGDGEDAPWFVRYLLRSVTDPSLLIEASRAWSNRQRDARLLARPGYQPRQHVLTSLGRAARVCPEIDGALRVSAATEGHSLATPQALEFLSERAAALRQMGFNVLLPAWWARKGPRAKLALRGAVKSTTGPTGAPGLDVLASVEWSVVLGDTALDRAELERLASEKSALVRIRGQWVHLTPDEIAAAVKFWKTRKVPKVAADELMRLAIGLGSGPGGLPVDRIDAEGALGTALARLLGKEPVVEPDLGPGFVCDLRPYQRRGLAWLNFMRSMGLGACLADDMGLGKTVQFLASVHARRSEGPALVVCPTSVVGNWQREAARFAPELRVLVHHGPGRARGDALAFAADRHDLVVTSYSLMQRDADLLTGIEWAVVALDEAQNIKNAATRQALAARALQTRSRVAMTGTPVENHIGELWSLMQFLNPGFLGTRDRFRKQYYLPIQLDRNMEAAEGLRKVTAPFIMRRLKTDRSIINDLPDKLEMKVFCNLTREQATLYEAVVRDSTQIIDKADGIERRGAVLAALTRLKQVCNHPAHYLGDNSEMPNRSGKTERLCEMLAEAVAAGDKALVFTQFAEMGEMLQGYLRSVIGRDVLLLHGGVPKARRDAMVQQFQEDPDAAVFVLSLKAGGVGLNLTAANHVFHFDRWWNPAVENQATDRAFRIGQTKNVQVHKMICSGTVEERIDGLIESKLEIAGAVVGTGEQWLTELSGNELRTLFALDPKAVME